MHPKDLKNPGRQTDHPHVDGALLRFRWAELEPKQGEYRFEVVEERIAPWVAAGKKIIIGIMPTAQRAGFTPRWVFRHVPAIDFIRTGKNTPVHQIKSWDPKFLRLEEPLIRAFGRRYESDSRIEAVLVGVAHLGFITAAPNKGGAKAHLEQGWTPDRWFEYALEVAALYRKVFPTKKLWMRGSPVIVRARKPAKIGYPGHAAHFVDVRDRILLTAAEKYNISVGANGLGPDARRFMQTGIPKLFTKLAPGVNEERYSLELGDDWPLWVPPDRRRGINRGKDNAFFKTCLENAIGGVRGIPPTNISFMKMLDHDLNCTNPNGPYHQPDCEKKLIWLKSKLRRVSPRETRRPPP